MFAGKPEGEESTMFTGLAADIRTRKPHYASDFADAMHRKVLSSSLYLFFACLANAIAFGALSSLLTGGELGIIEMLIATAVGGVIYALFSAQPITLLGGTGPIVIFTALLYKASQDLGLSFIAVYAWTGIWAGAMLILLSITNASRLMMFFSRFTDDIFAALVSIIFIVESFKGVAKDILSDATTVSGGLIIAAIASGTFLIAMVLRMLRYVGHRPLPGTRVLADFAPTVAIVAMTFVAIVISSNAIKGPAVPESFSITSTGRPWLVDLLALPPWAIFSCLLPASFAAILLFLDQNITSRIINESDAPLVKGKGYHLDLLLIGMFTFCFSFFGLPWIVAATVHSVNHLKSLTVEGAVADGPAVAVVENRISALTIHLAIATSLLLLSYVSLIPMPVLLGLFIYMGVMALWGNDFFIRALTLFRLPLASMSASGDTMVPKRTRDRYTLVQGACFAILWVVKSSILGILFPVFIALCVPVRLTLGRLFSQDDLDLLDDYDRH